MNHDSSPLLGRIQERTAKIVVIGIGYAGLPLAVELAKVGFSTIGLDLDAQRVSALKSGRSYIPDVTNAELTGLIHRHRLDATTDSGVLATADVVIVCVPTPLDKTRAPDMAHIVAAADQVARHQHPHMLVVLESTTYPGTTSELLAPKLTAGGYELGRDVFLAFSPERIDPNNREFGIRNTPKVLGGQTPACREMAEALYRQIIDQVVPVSSTETAEMVKLLENTFRAVNIALVNEIALMSRKLGVNPFEVVRAAATKPFGFMPFQPGPGLGGHCIPIDPLYLSWRMRAFDCPARFIELADSVNASMPEHVVQRVAEVLNQFRKPLSGSRVLVYGVAYKRDVADTRESPALPILRGLRAQGADVAYSDPLVPELNLDGASLRSVDPQADYAAYDAVVIVTDHTELERERLLRQAPLVIDTRDALAHTAGDRAKVHGL